MAIVKMNKFTLLTFESHKEMLLKELQKFEDVHFRNLQNDDLPELKLLEKDMSPEKINHCEAELSKIKFAMSKIEPYVVKPGLIKSLTTEPKSMAFDAFDSYPEAYDYNTVFENAKALDEQINSIKSRITALHAENELLRPWVKLDVSPAELERFRNTSCIVGAVNRASADNFRSSVGETFKNVYIELIGNIKDDVTVLVMIPTDEYDEALIFFKSLGFTRLTLNFKGVPSDMIKANNEETTKLQASRDAALESIKGLAGEYEGLQIAFDYYETLLERGLACQNFLKMRSTVLIEGWVPHEDTQAFVGIVDRVCGSDYYLEKAEVDKDCEEVPIKLKNNRMISVFEDITMMFSLPKYNELDPTPLLAPFYMLFFGLMLGDAGYGLLLALGSGAAILFFKLKENTKKFLEFFFYLGLSTILGGLVYGSVFGFTVFTPIQAADGTYKAIIDTQTDVITMMLVSVALGVLQVLFGICVKGYMLIRDGKIFDAIFDSFFWVLALLSGTGMILIYAGIVPESISGIIPWVFLLSLIGLAATQGRENPSIAGKIGGGIYAVYGITGYIGDFVSYTRIAALALAGAYIAYSFNLMASLIPSGIIGIVFGGIIMVVGHALSLALNALGAYVHTCRLQYVEFFGKFFEGGGVPFSAFKLKNKYITIIK